MAFINPANNDITVVAINTNKTKAKNFSFNSFANKPASFDMYRSSATENCGYVGKFTGNSFDMPAYSVVTLCFKAAESDWQWGPSAPTNIQASSITDNAVTITWNAVSGWTLHSASGNSTVATTGYTIYQNGVKKTVDGPTTKLTYTFTGLKPGTTYTFDVVTRDALYNESVLGRITVTTTCTTGGCITPPPGSLEATGALVTVSPNPASEAITLNLPDENIYNISVISISGAVALEKQNVVNGDQISVASLAKGIYVVIAQCGDKIYKTKLAVN